MASFIFKKTSRGMETLALLESVSMALNVLANYLILESNSSPKYLISSYFSVAVGFLTFGSFEFFLDLDLVFLKFSDLLLDWYVSGPPSF